MMMLSFPAAIGCHGWNILDMSSDLSHIPIFGLEPRAQTKAAVFCSFLNQHFFAKFHCVV